MLSNLPFGSGVVVSASAQAHLTRVSTLSGRTTALSGQLSEADRRRAAHGISVSCCLSAAGVRFSGHPVPPGSWAILTVGLPDTSPCRTLTGFPCSTRARYDRGGCLLCPEDGGAHPADSTSPVGACRFPTASP
jgi:hypothetical protein